LEKAKESMPKPAKTEHRQSTGVFTDKFDDDPIPF
jgi:hypothetical protein